MESARLRLRRFKSTDLDNMRMLESDPEVVRWSPLREPISRERSQERLESWVAKEKEREPLGIWAVETRDTSEFVGWLMLIQTTYDAPELGYMIVQKHWGKRYATEASARLLEHAFKDLQLPAVYAGIDQAHEVSRQILLRLGFEHYGLKTQFDKALNHEIILETFRLPADRFLSSIHLG